MSGANKASQVTAGEGDHWGVKVLVLNSPFVAYSEWDILGAPERARGEREREECEESEVLGSRRV